MQNDVASNSTWSIIRCENDKYWQTTRKYIEILTEKLLKRYRIGSRYITSHDFFVSSVTSERKEKIKVEREY